MDLPVPTPGATTTHHTVLAYLTYVSTYATSLEKSTVHGQVSESYFVSPVWRKCFSINKAVEPTAPSTTALPQSSVLIRTNLADPRTRVLDVPANPSHPIYKVHVHGGLWVPRTTHGARLVTASQATRTHTSRSTSTWPSLEQRRRTARCWPAGAPASGQRQSTRDHHVRCISPNRFRRFFLFFQMSELYLKRLQRVLWLPIR